MSDEQPRLVKKDGERVTPSEATVSRSEFMEALAALAAGIKDAVVTQVQAQQAQGDALATLIAKSQAEFEKNDENHWMRIYASKSAFNPLGENLAFDGARSRNFLNGDILWVGTRCIWHEQTYDEVVLLNQLESGEYHDGEWVVKDLSPDVKGSRKLHVQFPNLDPDKRAELPNGYWDYNAKDDDGTPLIGMDLEHPAKKGRLVTGMEIMLREMVAEAQARKAAA